MLKHLKTTGNRMINTFKLLLITSFVLLGACQQSSKINKSELNTAQADVNEILTIITVEAIKEQDYLQAQRSITGLILSNDTNSLEFIYSAIISLPQDLGLEIVNSSLNLDSVKNSSEQLFGIAKIFISYKNNDKALELINKSIAIKPKNLEARYWRARLLSILKQYEKSEEDFEYLTKIAPKNKEYAEQYASFLQETKQYDKAQKILSNQETNPENLFRRIIFNLQAENKDVANELYKDLKSFNVEEEKNNRKYFLVAEAAYFLEKFNDSEKYYKKVLGGDSYLDARDMLSLIMYEDKRYNESKEILHQLQNAEEKYAIKAYRLESQINKLEGDTDAAIDTLNRSLQLLPNNPILLYDRAMLNESIGNMESTEKDLLQIIKDDPKNHEALNALGYSLADHDLKLDLAYLYIQKAIDLAPENPAIIDSLGWVQYKLGQYKEAELNFKRALETDIHDPELYIHLHKTLLKLNKNQEAKDLLIKAKSIFPENEIFQD